MTNWTEWNGGECPVHENTIVDVKFRDGYRDPWTHNSTADSWEWRHGHGEHPGEDIIAYRVVEPYFLDTQHLVPVAPSADLAA